MTTCRAHPDRDAVARCSHCSDELCADCLAPGTSEPTCFDCSVTVSATAVQKQRDDEAHAARVASTRPAPRASRRLRALVAVGVVLAVVEAALFVMLRPATPPPPDPGSQRERHRAAQSRAVADVIVASEAVESYRREHGRPPADLQTLLASLPPPVADSLHTAEVAYRADDRTWSLRVTAGATPPVEMGSDLTGPVRPEGENHGAL